MADESKELPLSVEAEIEATELAPRPEERRGKHQAKISVAIVRDYMP